jgi:hypothetical protein
MKNEFFNGIKAYLAVFGILIILGFNSCYKHRDCINGSGLMVEEDRQVSSFDFIKALGSYRIFVRKDAVQSLKLVGDESILPRIETRVEGNTLIIEPERGYSIYEKIEVHVSMPSIRGFFLPGASHVTGLEAFETDSLFLKIAGAGKIEMEVSANSIESVVAGAGVISLRGSAESHTVSLSGVGKLEAEDLKVKHYEIKVAGSGSCRIYVEETLRAVITGSGIIYYRGEPSIINTTITGVGKVVKID